MFARIVSAIVLLLALMALPGAVAQAPEAGATSVRPADGATMVYVPAGEFLMGVKPGEGFEREKPQRAVYLDAYWIDRTEVTNRQFEAFVTAKGYRTDAEKGGSGVVWTGEESLEPAAGQTEADWLPAVEGADWQHPEGPASGIADRADYPVVQVSWNDGQAFCKWAGGRLPTEAEWEKAARGTEGRWYPWGNDMPSCERAIVADKTGLGCGRGKPWPVGSKPAGASPYGALDMSGNVWETAADFWEGQDYENAPTTNPKGLDRGKEVVSRGGGWMESLTEPQLRAAHRDRWMPDERSNVDGFRCAMSAGEPVTATVPAAAAKPLRVLIIGDEAVEGFENHLPKLAGSGAAPAALDLKVLSSGGLPPELWWTTGPYVSPEIEALQAGKGDWDAVVLEHVLGESWPYVADFTDFVPKFDEAIKKVGAKTVLLLPWSYGKVWGTTDEYAAVYRKSAADLGALVAPAGLALERAKKERPELVNFGVEAVNAEGLYLELCVLYGTLFDRSPEGLDDWNLAPADAAYLQKVAWETVRAEAAQ